MVNIPDHPTIRNMEHTGTPDGKAIDYPICPVCGEECTVLYKSTRGEIVGCDECIDEVNAWSEQYYG